MTTKNGVVKTSLTFHPESVSLETVSNENSGLSWRFGVAGQGEWRLWAIHGDTGNLPPVELPPVSFRKTICWELRGLGNTPAGVFKPYRRQVNVASPLPLLL